jgi:hypothetical protein
VNAMAKTFAILAQGSSFMHGSNTGNGGSADVRINDLFTYVAYQVKKVFLHTCKLPTYVMFQCIM